MKLDLYFEQEIVDGVLCFRNRHDEEWTPYTLEQLSNMVIGYQNNIEYILEDNKSLEISRHQQLWNALFFLRGHDGSKNE